MSAKPNPVQPSGIRPFRASSSFAAGTRLRPLEKLAPAGAIVAHQRPPRMQNGVGAEATSSRKARGRNKTWCGCPVSNEFYMLHLSLLDALESSGWSESAWRRTGAEKDDLSHRHAARRHGFDVGTVQLDRDALVGRLGDHRKRTPARIQRLLRSRVLGV